MSKKEDKKKWKQNERRYNQAALINSLTLKNAILSWFQPAADQPLFDVHGDL